ncbi:MAG: hypothetical protein ABL925_05880 [Methylococcales bacterium]
MSSLTKAMLFMVLFSGVTDSFYLQAAPREAARPNNAALLKLQAEVKTLTEERDAAKAETAKLAAEAEQLKKANADVLALKDQLSNALQAQQSSAAAVRQRLDETHAKLLEAIDKHKQVSEAKTELTTELTALQGKQQATEQQLQLCGQHNVKLLESGKELLEHYQNKGTFSSLLQDEPVLRFQSVEMENIVQDYQDKLNAGQFKSSTTSN